MTVSISVVMPTLGRKSLPAVLRELELQMSDHDEVIVVNDSRNGTDCDPLMAAMNVRNKRYARLDDWMSQCGNAQRNYALRYANRDVVWFVDDDDTILPGAMQTIRSEATALRPKIFKMRYYDRVLWDRREIFEGNFGPPQVIIPTPLARIFAWPVPSSGNHGQDFWWLSKVFSVCDPEWSESIIYQCRSHGEGVA